MVKLLKIFNCWDMFFKQDILRKISAQSNLKEFVSTIFLDFLTLQNSLGEEVVHLS